MELSTLNDIESSLINQGRLRILNAPMKTTLAKRVKEARESVGMTPAEFSRAIGVTKAALSLIEDGTTKTLRHKTALEIQRVTGYRDEWVNTGATPKKVSEKNVEPGPAIRAKVPLISWTTAGRWNEVHDPLPPGEGDEWVSTTATVGPNSFALRVVGDSMEPKIPDGSIVIIDPAAPYSHGKIVLAKRTNDQEATLKQLWYDGAMPRLRPLNTRYPILEMPSDTRIIGVAVRLELDL